MTLLNRVFYLASELRPVLPPSRLMGMLGTGWSRVIKAAAENGLGGVPAALGDVSFEQVISLYESGSESGASPDLDEFRAALSGIIYEKICSNSDMSSLDKLKLSSDLYNWQSGKSASGVSDQELDWDSEVETPPFTESGFWPLDKINGPLGIPQGVITLLARPEEGKTTMALAIACEWRRRDIGPVALIQTEIAPSALITKIKGMTGEEKLFRKGIDTLYFGNRTADKAFETLLEYPDPDRLVIFDSITGYAGQGDTPDSRARYANLYMNMMQIKNVNRMSLVCGHVKRGVELADIESAAGSRVIEQMSDVMVYLKKDNSPRPDRKLEAKVSILKNRWQSHEEPIHFLMDYALGKAYPSDFDEWGDEE